MTEHDFSILKMVLGDSFVIWYSLNELINTSLFLHKLPENKFVFFSIFCAFGYKMTRSLIINIIELPCYNMNLMIIYEGIVFITAIFNWIRVFKEFVSF